MSYRVVYDGNLAAWDEWYQKRTVGSVTGRDPVIKIAVCKRGRRRR